MESAGTVTSRANNAMQPWGGYLQPKKLNVVTYDDGQELNMVENIQGGIVGMTVEYLTRFFMGEDKEEAFDTSLKGAYVANTLKNKKSLKTALRLLEGINTLDERSIINTCKLVSYDVWSRNVFAALSARSDYADIKPDKGTIKNIHIMIERCLGFFEKTGSILKIKPRFEPPDTQESEYYEWLKNGTGNFGGYTRTVYNGEGDFMTEDTIWDLKVLKTRVRSKHTLQLLMYWIMAQHSGQECYARLKNVGIFNPRDNKSYTFDVTQLPYEVITEIENEIICY